MALWTWELVKIKVLFITAQIHHQILNSLHGLINIHKFNINFLDCIVDLFYANIFLIYLDVAYRQAPKNHNAKFIKIILITLLNAFNLNDWLENLTKGKNNSHVPGDMAINRPFIAWLENRELVAKMLFIWNLVKSCLN